MNSIIKSYGKCFDNEVLDLESFKLYYRFIYFLGMGNNYVDRTNTVVFPVRTNILKPCELPKQLFTQLSYSEICDFRANEIMDFAVKNNKTIYLMYSGGIDSTLMLCAFLKNFNNVTLNQKLVVLLSSESINENRDFYYTFIFNNLRIKSSINFSNLLDDPDNIFLTGEGNDSLFAPLKSREFIIGKQYSLLNANLKENIKTLIEYFNPKGIYTQLEVHLFLQTLFTMFENAPVKIDTIYKFFWYIHFNCGYQKMFLRYLPNFTNTDLIKIDTNYFSFYTCDKFQQWALTNCDTLLGQSWQDLKSVCKDYIIDYTGQETYRNKPKVRSMIRLIDIPNQFNYVDSHFIMHKDLININYINENNCFKTS